MRVLVTGSRDWPKHVVLPVMMLAAFKDCTIVVGDCPTGIDAMIRAARPDAEVHEADWDQHGKAAGPIRNQAMVDSGADVCLAFFNGTPRNRSGTADCRRRAIAAGVPTYSIERWQGA